MAVLFVFAGIYKALINSVNLTDRIKAPVGYF